MLVIGNAVLELNCKRGSPEDDSYLCLYSIQFELRTGDIVFINHSVLILELNFKCFNRKCLVTVTFPKHGNWSLTGLSWLRMTFIKYDDKKI